MFYSFFLNNLSKLTSSLNLGISFPIRKSRGLNPLDFFLPLALDQREDRLVDLVGGGGQLLPGAVELLLQLLGQLHQLPQLLLRPAGPAPRVLCRLLEHVGAVHGLVLLRLHGLHLPLDGVHGGGGGGGDWGTAQHIYGRLENGLDLRTELGKFANTKNQKYGKFSCIWFLAFGVYAVV